MKDENRFTAELYARLWPWLDHSRPAQVMLDDGGSGSIAHPDMCIVFDGSSRELRIECKIVEAYGQNKNCIDPTDKQLRTWSPATCEARPHLWAAKMEDGDTYYLWPHEAFAQEFGDRAAAGTSRRAVRVPQDARNKPLSFTRLFLAIMDYAVTNGFLK